MHLCLNCGIRKRRLNFLQVHVILLQKNNCFIHKIKDFKVKFEIIKYYSTYCTYQVEAKNQEEAYHLADRLSINRNEILDNLENWNEADEIRRITNNS